MPSIKPTPVGPLTGVLDLRSSPDELPRDALRMRLNMRTTGQGKLRRGNGFEKLLNSGSYNNADFHDQLLALSGASMRQPVTMLFEAQSSRKMRSLFAATQSTIAQLNTHSGNYRIVGSGLGGTPSQSVATPRWKAANLGNYVAFTNDFDKVKYFVLEQPPDPDTGKILYDIPDLETIGLSRAAVIWQWHSVLFLANVEMDGERAAYRIVWSDFNDPTGFDPANLQSITGTKDLFPHEEILAGAPFGNSFLIYTTHGIWEMIAVGGEQSFDFKRAYDGEKDELKGVLALPNTLVSTHDTHTYISHDGIYQFTQYAPAPDRPEWLHRGTADLFENLDAGACQVHVGAIYGDEILFSVAHNGTANHCPDYTLRINKTYKVVDVMDVGFTALSQFTPQDNETIRDFIISNQLCTVAGLAAQGYPYGNEGLPRPLPEGESPFIPDCFYTTITQHVSDGAGGTILAEDWNQAVTTPQSLCTLVGGTRLDEICRACKVPPILIGAYTGDWCLKNLNPEIFYREICQNPGATGQTTADGYYASVGSYALDGILSVLRFAPANVMDNMIELSQLEVKFTPVEQQNPLGVSLRVGISAQPADPNTNNRALVWFQHSSQALAYETFKTPAQHLADATQPTERAHWHVWRVGRFVYVELTISGVGGDALFNSIEAVLRALGETRNY